MAATEPTAAPGDRQNPQLARNILSLRNCLALSAAVMAPVLAVILNAPAGGADAGAALPFAFLLAFIAALFVGNTVIEFAKKLSSAGSFYTFCSRAMGSLAGFFTGWLYAGAFVVLTVGLFTANGAFLHTYLQSTFSWNVPWWILGIILLGDRDDALGPQHQDLGPAGPDPARPGDAHLLAAGADHRDHPGRARQQPDLLQPVRRARAASPASAWPWSSACCRSSASRRRPCSARKPATPSGTCRCAVRFALDRGGRLLRLRRLRARRRVPPQHRRRAEGVPGQPRPVLHARADSTRPGSSSPSTWPPSPGCSPACSPC